MHQKQVIDLLACQNYGSVSSQKNTTDRIQGKQSNNIYAIDTDYKKNFTAALLT